MSFLIEFEYGAEAMFDQEGNNLTLDNMLESALN